MDVFQRRLTALASQGGAASDVVILSDLDRAQAAVLRDVWRETSLTTRRWLVDTMAELGEEQIEYNFGRALRVALRDQDAGVRATAIAALWEDEGDDFLSYLLDSGVGDADPVVREAAILALSRFSRLAAEDELHSRRAGDLQATLLRLARQSESVEERRRALEAVGAYADDAAVIQEIELAYGSSDELLRTSAVYAMGQNLDERWLPLIIEEMASPTAAIRYEATKASGHFGDRRAVPRLIDRLGDEDREVQLAAIGALGQIGGSASVNILKRLAVSKEAVVREAAEDALDEAVFAANPIVPGAQLTRSLERD